MVPFVSLSHSFPNILNCHQRQDCKHSLLSTGALYFRAIAAAVAYFVEFFFKQAIFANGLTWTSVKLQGK